MVKNANEYIKDHIHLNCEKDMKTSLINHVFISFSAVHMDTYMIFHTFTCTVGLCWRLKVEQPGKSLIVLMSFLSSTR